MAGYAVAGLLGLEVVNKVSNIITGSSEKTPTQTGLDTINKLLDFLTKWLPILLIAGGLLFALSFIRSALK